MRTAHVHTARLAPAQTLLADDDGPWARACRDVWNAALDERLGALKAARGRTMPSGWWPTYASQCRRLTEAKREAPWLRDAPHHVLQQTLKDLDRAWAAWLFERRAAVPGQEAGRPQLVGTVVPVPRPQPVLGRAHLATVGPRAAPKVGLVKFRWDRNLPDGATVTNVTLSRDRVGDWQVSFAIDVPDTEVAHPNPGSVVGVDRGVVVLAATSDGGLHDRQVLGSANLGPDLFTDGERRRLRRLEQRKARQQRGSTNAATTRRQIAKLRRTQARQRADLAHKVSHQLAGTYESVVVEKLATRTMTRSASGTVGAPGTNVSQKRGLNRSIASKGWGMLRTHLAYKTARAAGRLVEVDARNTSRTCHLCHTVDASSRENQARFRCTACGHVCHADVNAAINILTRAAPAGVECKGSDGGRPLAACRALQPSGGATMQEPSGRSRARHAA